MKLNQVANDLDYSCFSRIDSTGVVSASAESTFYDAGKSDHSLLTRVVSAKSNMADDYPESLVLDCSVLLYKSMPTPFSSLLVDVQFGPDQSHVYRTRLVNDTVYYDESGLGFPIDSIRPTDFNRHLR